MLLRGPRRRFVSVGLCQAAALHLESEKTSASLRPRKAGQGGEEEGPKAESLIREKMHANLYPYTRMYIMFTRGSYNQRFMLRIERPDPTLRHHRRSQKFGLRS